MCVSLYVCVHVYAQVCIYPRVPHPELRTNPRVESGGWWDVMMQLRVQFAP